MSESGQGWDTDRHGSIVQELAAQFDLSVTPALQAFYVATYATAVYDIADEVSPGMTRERVIAEFAPPMAPAAPEDEVSAG